MKPTQQISKNFNLNNDEISTEKLIEAIQLPNSEKALAMISKCKNINTITNGTTCIHTAIRYKKLSILEKLIEQGANVNLKDSTENSPIYDAAWNNFPEGVKLLYNKGADTKVNMADNPLGTIYEAIELWSKTNLDKKDLYDELKILIPKQKLVTDLSCAKRYNTEKDAEHFKNCI